MKVSKMPRLRRHKFRGRQGERLESRELLAYSALALPDVSSNESVRELVAGDGRLFYVAESFDSGQELWTSVGTAAGTERLSDFNGGPMDSDVADLQFSNGRLFFTATSAATGNELGVSDGTPGGTQLLDLVSGSNSSHVEQLTTAGGKAIFSALDAAQTGRDFYVSDGTLAGTQPLPAALASVDAWRGVGDRFWYVQSDGVNPSELWTWDGLASNGTLAGTLPPGVTLDDIRNPTAFQSSFVFALVNELWTTDLSPTDTQMIYRFGDVSNALDGQFTVSGEMFYFVATEDQIGTPPSNRTGQEVWKSDGTAVGTAMVVDLHSGPESSHPRLLKGTNGEATFFASDGIQSGLWHTVGTSGGTSKIANLQPGVSTDTSGSSLFFPASNGTDDGDQIWMTDGTRAGTEKVFDLVAAELGYVTDLAHVGTTPYFTSTDYATSFSDTLMKLVEHQEIANVDFTDVVEVNSEVSFSSTLTGTTFPPINYQWDFGDGMTASGVSMTDVNHTYTSPGLYTVSLTIEDALGFRDEFVGRLGVTSTTPLIEYNETTGALTVTANEPLLSITLLSSGGNFSNAPAGDLGAGPSVDSDTRITRYDATGFTRVDLGPVAATGLSESELLADLKVIATPLAGGVFSDVRVLHRDGGSDVVVSYDALTGELVSRSQQPLTTFQVRSTESVFDGVRPATLTHSFDAYTPTQIFKLDAAGAALEIDFGPSVLAGESLTDLRDAWTFSGSTAAGPVSHFSLRAMQRITPLTSAPPIAVLNGPSAIDEGSTLTLDALGSVDPDTPSLTFAWDVNGDDITDASGAQVSFTWAELQALTPPVDDGDFTITLTASDGTATHETSTRLSVNNLSPQLTELFVNATATVGQQTAMSANAVDPGNDPLTFTWDFGDGTAPVSARSPMHTYSAPGTYSVTVSVTDNQGGLDSQTSEIVVDQPQLFDETPLSVGSSRGNGVATGDLDGDGDSDLILVGGGANPNQIWFNDGFGNFVNSGQSLGTSEGFRVAVGDIDGDLDLDLWIAHGRETAAADTIWINDGSGQFSASPQVLPSLRTADVEFADLDNDGDLDAVTAYINGTATSRIWLNNGTGSFTATAASIGGTSRDVEIVDVDGDLDQDLVFANGANADELWINQGNATFVKSGQAFGPANSVSIAAGNLNGMGGIDLYIASQGQGLPADRIWNGDGNGLFTDSGQLKGSSLGTSVALGDLDADGDVDAFLTNDFTVANNVLLNNGSGSLLTSSVGLGNGQSKHVTLVDVDNDSDLDAIVANADQPFQIYFNLTVVIAQAPIAGDDSFELTEDTVLDEPAVSGLLVNDYDPDRGTLSVSDYDTTSSMGAVVSVASDGSYTYDPSGAAAIQSLDLGDSAIDTFTYTIRDEDGQTDTATVTLILAGQNDTPVAVDDFAAVDANAETDLTDTLLVNDSDVDADDILSVSNVDTTTTLGAVSLEDGRVSYDPRLAFVSLAAGETALDQFGYVVEDTSNAMHNAIVHVTITGVNDVPSAVDDSTDVPEDAVEVLLTTTLLANDSDPDNGDSLTITAIGTTGTIGQVTLQNGVVRYTPGESFQDLGPGESRLDRFDYQISDESGATRNASVEITVTGANDAPVAAADVISVAAESPASDITDNLLDNDSDVDASDTLTVTGIDTQQTLGIATLVAGRVSYQPGDAFDFLSSGETATDTFRYEVTDNDGAFATATVTLTIVGTDDDPVVAIDDTIDGINEGDGTLDISSVIENDQGSGLQITAVFTETTMGVATLVDGQLRYEPGDAFEVLGGTEEVQDQFVYQITDRFGATATATVTLNVSGINDRPVANDDTIGQAFTAGDASRDLTAEILSNDLDIDQDSTLTISRLETTGTLGSVQLVDGTILYAPGAAFDDLAPGQTVLDQFVYELLDDGGQTDTATVTVSITGRSTGLPGDFDQSGSVDANDIDLLCTGVRGSFDELFDLDDNGIVDLRDLDFLVENILGTTAGDADLDGVFNSTDLINIFITAEYDDALIGNSRWATGDWNCDGEFNSSDLIRAFAAGGYSLAARPNSLVRAALEAEASREEKQRRQSSTESTETHVAS